MSPRHLPKTLSLQALLSPFTPFDGRRLHEFGAILPRTAPPGVFDSPKNHGVYRLASPAPRRNVYYRDWSFCAVRFPYLSPMSLTLFPDPLHGLPQVFPLHMETWVCFFDGRSFELKVALCLGS